MADFKFFTNGNSNPQGKPRVYVTAHPDDYELYLEEISKNILKRQNCAVFYLPPDADYRENENYELDLAEMQLFVIPVTEKLLKEPCRAMDVDVPLAISNHIPVLPIMEKDGLEELYAAKFGNLQYLDHVTKDKTAIGFDEKLTAFLDSVVVGDELSEKVRAAFDAYIFLSYRKKDRAYAQELMKLIHRNDFCRDIAIWYDEFLTPGEDFSDAIEAAMKKSDLFALAVTPNLINEENYVHTVEYPKARELKKTILPAELQPTDHVVLKELYKEIPETVEMENNEAFEDRLRRDLITAIRNKKDMPSYQRLSRKLNGLSDQTEVQDERQKEDLKERKGFLQRLKQKWQKVAVTEQFNEPEHNFFIGLAYLSGIDVEVNKERAVELISSAADAGVYEAAKKMVSMCQNGDGMERSYTKSAEWKKKQVEILRERIETKPDAEEIHILLQDMLELGDLLQGELLLWEDSYAVFSECISLAERFAREYSDGSYERFLSAGLARISGYKHHKAKEIHSLSSPEKKHFMEESESFCRRSMLLREEAFKKSPTIQNKREVGWAYYNITLVLRDKGALKDQDQTACHKESYYYADKARIIAEELVKETGSLQDRNDLIRAYRALSYSCEYGRSRLEKTEWTLKETQATEELAEETGTKDHLERVATCYLNLGLRGYEDWNMYALEKCVYIYRQLVKEYPDLKKYQKSLEEKEDLMKRYIYHMYERPSDHLKRSEDLIKVGEDPDGFFAQFMLKLEKDPDVISMKNDCDQIAKEAIDYYNSEEYKAKLRADTERLAEDLRRAGFDPMSFEAFREALDKLGITEIPTV